MLWRHLAGKIINTSMHRRTFIELHVQQYAYRLKGTRHKQNSLSGNTLFNYMPTYTRSQKKS